MAESKKFLLFVLTIVWTTSITESTLPDCKKPLVSIGTGCYNFQNLSLSFEQYSDAVKACPPDSHPVDIGSEEELEILSRAVKARLSSRTPFNGIWTSGSRTSNVENYSWDTSTLAEQKKEVDYFAWLNNDTPLEKRNNSLALAFNTTTGLLGYIDVNPDYYPTGLGLVCKGVVCPPPICQYDTNCVPFVDPNGCTICSQCGGKRCKVQVDVEADGVAICTTCYCKRECDDVKKCLYGCHLVAREGGCPKCECPAAVVPVDVQLKFTKIVPNAGDMICLTVNKLIGVSEICTKKIVLRCRPTAILEDGYGHATVTVAVVTLSIKTSYPDFISVLNECKYFLENNLLRKIGSHTVENVLIEVPNYMPTPPPVTQSTCMKEKGNLPCDDTNRFYELRWEFNTRIGYCRPYVHNGCQSDRENSFRTLLECSTSCSKARCFLPRNPDCCEVYNERWTYNPYTGICEPFKACEYGGNSNSFRTEDECYLACPREVCGEPVDVGPCRSMSVVPQYHYDIVTNECNIFNWGGCFGNGNKFRLCESCEEKCKAIPMNLELGTTTLGKATSAVKTTADPQNLSTMHHINRETPCICTVDGDPRVTTFDGSALLIDGVGIYLLLETELPERGQRFLLAVEAAQVAPGKYPGLLSIVRIYFKAENQLTMVENNSIWIDNLPVTDLPSTVGDITVSGVIGDVVRISSSIGYYVTARFGRSAHDMHIVCDMGDLVSGGSSTGLCGNCDGNPDDEFDLDSKDLSRDPDRYQKISEAYLRDLTFILSN